MTTAQRAAAKVPQDHLPKADTEPVDVSFEFDGYTYTIPTSEEWDIDVIEYAEDGLMTKALRSLLGEDQYKVFRKDHRTVRDLGRMYDAAGVAVGAPN